MGRNHLSFLTPALYPVPAVPVEDGVSLQEDGGRSASTGKYVLLTIVAIDLFSVALVVPLLPNTFKSLGGTAAGWGVFASVYSVSQVSGGVLLGGLSDRYGRSTGLQLSMMAAAVSYAMVGLANSIPMLLLSRVIVGLFKQTMTLSKALVADTTAPEERAAAVAQLSAAVSIGWMSGQAVGGTIAELTSEQTPAAIAVLLFVIDTIGVRLTLPHAAACNSEESVDKQSFQMKIKQIVTLLFSTRDLAAITALELSIQAVTRATRSMQAFALADRFGLSSGQLGRLGGLQGVAVLAVQSSGVGVLVRQYGEQKVLALALLASAAVCAVEVSDISVELWSFVVMPANALLIAVVEPCLSSLFVSASPPSQRGSALGSLDVLQSAVNAMAPLLAGWIYGLAGAKGLAASSGLMFLLLGLVSGAGVKAKQTKAE